MTSRLLTGLVRVGRGSSVVTPGSPGVSLSTSATKMDGQKFRTVQMFQVWEKPSARWKPSFKASTWSESFKESGGLTCGTTPNTCRRKKRLTCAERLEEKKNPCQKKKVCNLEKRTHFVGCFRGEACAWNKSACDDKNDSDKSNYSNCSNDMYQMYSSQGFYKFEDNRKKSKYVCRNTDCENEK